MSAPQHLCIRGDLHPKADVAHVWIEDPRFPWWPGAGWVVHLEYADGTDLTWLFKSLEAAEALRDEIRRQL